MKTLPMSLVVMAVAALVVLPMGGREARADEPPSSDSPAPGYQPTPVGPFEVAPLQGGSEVLIIKDVQPWTCSANEAALNELGKTFDVINCNQIDLPTLTGYDIVIIASDQTTATYDCLISHAGDLAAYAAGGGVLIGHATDMGWTGGHWAAPFLPGAVDHVDVIDESLTIVDPGSPIVAGMPGGGPVSDQQLDDWNHSTHGYFTNLPPGTNIIIGTTGNPMGEPTYIQYPWGSGHVLATMQTLEWVWPGCAGEVRPNAVAGRNVLRNEILLAQQELALHHKCYQIAGAPPPGPPVHLETQFGEEDVVVGPASLLCPPALKNGEGELEAPHLKCFDILGQDPRQVVRLRTQFGVEEGVAVRQATRLCVPALKEVLFPVPEPPVPPLPTAPHYECFELQTLDPAPGVTVDIETQFGIEPSVEVGLASYLCAPALKNGEGDLGAPHLKCYEIVGEDPPHIVNLETQFGIEQDVDVGPANLLCVRAYKTLLGPVGGIAGFPDIEEPAPATASSSGGSSFPYAVLAGVAAAALALVAMATGGWYVRRRWVR